MSNNPPVTALVARAADGDRLAWDALVERYAPLIWSICRRYQLSAADADDVGQAVWLQLLDRLGDLREPAALAYWLATTTRQECGRARRAAWGSQLPGPGLTAESVPDTQRLTAEQELLAAEWHAALRDAFTRLPHCCQELLVLLMGDQPLAGSVGPRHGNCLSKLRHDPAIAAWLDADIATDTGRPMAGVRQPARDR
jgi:RNA polymerase sigma factor (sigma-70 family)